MANEIRATYDTGKALYALTFNEEGQVYNEVGPDNGTFTAYVAADIDRYDTVLTEVAVASREYRGTFSFVIPAGSYSVVLFEQAGGGPVVVDDERIGETGIMYWDGDAEINHNMIDTVVDAILVHTGTTLPDEHAALPTANENRDAILDDATRFSGADIGVIAADVASIDGDPMRGTDSAAQQFSVDTLLTRLSAARAGYLDELAAANLPSDIDDILAYIDTMEADLKSYMLSDIIGIDSDTLKTLSDQLDVLGAGSGGTEEIYTVTDDSTGLPIDGVHVWVTTDIAGTNIIWAGYTNALGKVKYYHDLATGTTVYLWRELAGYTFVNPDLENTS